jgi:hypothetical protein
MAPSNPHDPQACDALIIIVIGSEEFLRREQGRPELSQEALMELGVLQDGETQS